MKAPIFGYPLMNFHDVQWSQIPPEFLMNVNIAHIEKETRQQLREKLKLTPPIDHTKDKCSSMSFLAEKILQQQHGQNFRDMIANYMQSELKFQSKLKDFTYGINKKSSKKLSPRGEKKQMRQNQQSIQSTPKSERSFRQNTNVNKQNRLLLMAGAKQKGYQRRLLKDQESKGIVSGDISLTNNSDLMSDKEKCNGEQIQVPQMRKNVQFGIGSLDEIQPVSKPPDIPIDPHTLRMFTTRRSSDTYCLQKTSENKEEFTRFHIPRNSHQQELSPLQNQGHLDEIEMIMTKRSSEKEIEEHLENLQKKPSGMSLFRPKDQKDSRFNSANRSKERIMLLQDEKDHENKKSPSSSAKKLSYMYIHRGSATERPTSELKQQKTNNAQHSPLQNKKLLQPFLLKSGSHNITNEEDNQLLQLSATDIEMITQQLQKQQFKHKKIKKSPTKKLSFAQQLLNLEAQKDSENENTPKAIASNLDNLHCKVIGSDGTLVEKPENLESWLRTSDGQEFVTKNKLYHLMIKKKPEIDHSEHHQVTLNLDKEEYMLKKESPDLLNVPLPKSSRNARKPVLMCEENNSQQNSNKISSAAYNIKNKGFEPSSTTHKVPQQKLSHRHLRYATQQSIRRNSNDKKIDTAQIIKMLPLQQNKPRNYKLGARFQNSMKRLYILSLKKHIKVIMSSPSSKQNNDIQSIISKKETQAGSSPHPQEDAVNQNIQIKSSYLYSPKRPFINSQQSQRMQMNQNGPNYFELNEPIGLEFNKNSVPLYSETKIEGPVSPLQRKFITTNSHFKFVEPHRCASSSQPRRKKVQLEEVDRFSDQKLQKQASNKEANSSRTNTRSRNRNELPTLREIENQHRRMNETEQLQKIYESTLKLTKISKEIVRSKPFEKALKIRALAKRQSLATVGEPKLQSIGTKNQQSNTLSQNDELTSLK